jgi:hypothetical protein
VPLPPGVQSHRSRRTLLKFSDFARTGPLRRQRDTPLTISLLAPVIADLDPLASHATPIGVWRWRQEGGATVVASRGGWWRLAARSGGRTDELRPDRTPPRTQADDG